MLKIMHVVGARPNFIKIAPIMHAMRQYNEQHAKPLFEQRLIHTGQHYDHKMSTLFFEQLQIPKPDVNLEIGSGPHGQQTGQIMEAFETVLLDERPDWVVVVGDVNSTVACALDCAKLHIPFIHVEAGLRSFDRSMPEEINRVLTDSIADLLFTTEASAEDNLLREGVAKNKIHFVGNVMIDSLLKFKPIAEQHSKLEAFGLKQADGKISDYVLSTLHRPSNVDEPTVLRSLAETFNDIADQLPVILPIHPRTRSRIDEFGLSEYFTAERGIHLVEPLGYLEFLDLTAQAKVVLSDSGGIQEETTILKVPCITLRDNTERPITLSCGGNQLVGHDKAKILAAFEAALALDPSQIQTPELWDGQAAERIVDVLVNI